MSFFIYFTTNFDWFDRSCLRIQKIWSFVSKRGQVLTFVGWWSQHPAASGKKYPLARSWTALNSIFLLNGKQSKQWSHHLQLSKMLLSKFGQHTTVENIVRLNEVFVAIVLIVFSSFSFRQFIQRSKRTNRYKIWWLVWRYRIQCGRKWTSSGKL